MLQKQPFIDNQIIFFFKSCEIFRKGFETGCFYKRFNPLSANHTKWSNTFKQLPTNCLSVFDHFVKLALKGLSLSMCHLVDYRDHLNCI